jgi:hypothetical protein
VQRIGGVTGGRLTGAIAAWFAIVIVCALPYAVLMFAAAVVDEQPEGRPLCPAGLCWVEAASPIGLFLVAVALTGSLTWFVCGSILHNGIGRPSRRLVALFPITHALVAMIPLGYVLVMLARSL